MQKKFAFFIIGSVIIFYISTLLAPKQSINVAPQAVTTPAAVQTADTVPSPISPVPEVIEHRSETLDNRKLKIVGTNQGGTFSNIFVHGYSENQNPVDLVMHLKENGYFGLRLDPAIGPKLNETAWDVKTDQDELSFAKSLPGRLRIVKRIRLDRDEYTGHLEIEIQNLSQDPVILENIVLGWGPIAQVGSDVHEAVFYDKGKLTPIAPAKKDEVRKETIEKGWAGLRSNYFCLLFYPQEGPMDIEVVRSADKTVGLNLILKNVAIPGTGSVQRRINLYFGPQNYDLLKKPGKDLQKIISFGMFHYIGLVMLFILKYFYALTRNYGLAIILLTILIRVILWWPTQRSYTSMKKMQKAMNQMQPRLKTLKEIYKNDQQKLNEETMKLYKEYQINPAGGCLPMVLQMPILFALWQTLTKAVELKGASFVWIWKDLSLKDPMYILPIVMGLSMFVQQKMTNTPAASPEAAQQQQVMLYFMPIFLTLISLFLPSGVLLYWVVSNLFGIAQQIYINQAE
jgi:YidC/Oxa1 family membrane protein insertase